MAQEVQRASRCGKHASPRKSNLSTVGVGGRALLLEVAYSLKMDVRALLLGATYFLEVDGRALLLEVIHSLKVDVRALLLGVAYGLEVPLLD